MTTEEKRRQTERIAQAISKLPPETVERLDLIVMGAAMVAPKQAEGEGVRAWIRLWKMLRKTQPPSLLTVWSS